MPLTIAVDGPVGAGKSSISDAVAKRLDILHLDTGAMYRAVGYAALLSGVDTHDEAALCALAEQVQVNVRYEKGMQRTLLDGEDVTDKIRTPKASMAASDVSKCAAVRRAMVAVQRSLSRGQDMLMDGRDIGTVVLPGATVKIFLTASPQVRAQRRHQELLSKGASESYEQVLADLLARDYQDTHRETDPLRQAEDAVVVDSSNLTFDETVEQILAIVEAAR